MLESHKIEKDSKYDNLIIFFISLISLGGIGGLLQPIRLLIIVFIPFLIKSLLTSPFLKKEFRYNYLFFAFWVLFGFISLIWVDNVRNSVRELFYLFINLCGYLLLIIFSTKAKNPVKSITKGWIIMIALTLPIAIYEIIFDIHLPWTKHDAELLSNFGYIILQRKYASVTFFNLNGYNTLLVSTFPFIFSAIFYEEISRLHRKIIWILIIILSYVVIVNSSRAAVLALLIAFAFILLLNIGKIKSFLIIILGLMSGFLVLSYISPNFYEFIFERFYTNTFEDNARNELIKSGLDALINSNFLGVGAANFTPYMKDNYFSLGVYAPHNLFLEILIEYGLLIFILFIGLFIQILRNIIRNNNRIRKFQIALGLIIFPLMSIINSGYLNFVFVFLYLASLFVISNNKFRS